ncbi:MAG TPA: Re/Si-specific NAD(P)(+) transhydrogenase subunit alpha [Acidimicrobiia bacterium]|jgi:NAD(P) transhydrogenase subunit alpha
MQIGVPREFRAGERRVALTPDVVKRLVAAGHEITIEKEAGLGSGFADDAYAAAGARIGSAAEALGSPLVAVVETPSIESLVSGSVLIGLLRPLDDPGSMQRLAAAGITSLAFELVPRITRAQAMDALSSQATVAGYQAAIEAANASNRFFPMLTTAAGTIAPARALILGAGVAGLQAIATCRRLGAVVSAFDVRQAVAEQVRSLGATFLEVDMTLQDSSTSGGYARELDADSEKAVLTGLAVHVAQSDVVISTAAIPGRAAPLLITAGMVASMKPGSVIVDLAAATGGNCELTKPGEAYLHKDVTIVGYTDMPSRKPQDASQMYARNVAALLSLLGTKGEVDFEDEILDQACVTHDGEIRHLRVKALTSS